MGKKIGLLLVLFFMFGSVAKAQRPDLPGSLVVDLGLNTWSKAPNRIDFNTFQSKTVNIVYYYDLPIGDKGFTFTPGIGLGFEKYSFSNDSTLVSSISNGSRTVSAASLSSVYPDADTFDKVKLGLNYLDIPLEFRYYTSKNNMNRGFRVALGGKVGVLYSSFTKAKYQDILADNHMVKNRQDLGFNRIRYGAQARVGFGGFSLFGYYELSNKFDTPPVGGKDTKVFTLGLSITGF